MSVLTVAAAAVAVVVASLLLPGRQVAGVARLLGVLVDQRLGALPLLLEVLYLVQIVTDLGQLEGSWAGRAGGRVTNQSAGARGR